MNVRALEILLAGQPAGILFQYGEQGEDPVIRFEASEAFAARPDAPVLSLSMLAPTPDAQRALWLNRTAPIFNGQPAGHGNTWLPAFFQGLLPEGVFREHLAQLRGCDPHDHLELLAAGGLDLPGNLTARPIELTPRDMTHLVTQDADALEMSVMQAPLDTAMSISGVQPKIGVTEKDGRYVARTRLGDTRIIAKLPTVGYPLLPEVEHLSLLLAQAAGVDTCEAKLEPLEKLEAEHGYDLGDDVHAQTRFLAVERFDRHADGSRTHVEDFGQILGMVPARKYSRSYLEIAALLMAPPKAYAGQPNRMGEPAVHELLRRLVVNELLGNVDMHLKNIGVIYRDGRTPELSPAYDIVAYAAYGMRQGHALHLLPPDPQAPKARLKAGEPARAGRPQVTPALLRTFCAKLDIPEKPAATAIAGAVKLAVRHWPDLIAASALTQRQKSNLSTHVEAHPMVASLRRRGHAAPTSAPG
ncbi:MAG TPA: type II toxin-antitoxin system HipA family toxin [Bordetella sp.]